MYTSLFAYVYVFLCVHMDVCVCVHVEYLHCMGVSKPVGSRNLLSVVTHWLSLAESLTPGDTADMLVTVSDALCLLSQIHSPALSACSPLQG